MKEEHHSASDYRTEGKLSKFQSRKRTAEMFLLLVSVMFVDLTYLHGLPLNKQLSS